MLLVAKFCRIFTSVYFVYTKCVSGPENNLFWDDTSWNLPFRDDSGLNIKIFMNFSSRLHVLQFDGNVLPANNENLGACVILG